MAKYYRPVRLLLVEDNPSDVWLLREALRLSEFPVNITIARDGVEATHYLHQVEAQIDQKPDLVLLDLNLPRKNGCEVLSEVKRSRVLQPIPIVVLTSSSAEEERRQALELKASAFLTKPDSLPDYVDMVLGLERFWQPDLNLPQTA
jgi:two-component system, chemotaxis family, response regulator Rcp1